MAATLAEASRERRDIVTGEVMAEDRLIRFVAGPQGEFLAYLAAAPVYALYGLGDTGLPSSTWQPRVGQGFRGPAMSYHLRTGGHGLTAADWNVYLNGDLFAR